MAKRAAKPKIPDSAKRWVKRAVAFVVALGAVAGAITAMKALWPAPDPPDPEDSAHLSIRVISQVRLSDYARRLESVQPQGFRRVQPTDTTNADPTVESTGNPTESTEIPPTTSGSETSQTTSDPPGAEVQLRQQPDPRTVDEITKEVVRQAPYCRRLAARGCGTARAALRVLAEQSVGDTADAAEIDPRVAAERVLEILEDARRTAELEPIGAIVTVDAVLVGLRDRPVELTWAMWHETGGQRLHPEWFSKHLAYQLLAATDHDSATVQLWVPLPTMPGPFLVDVEATLEGDGIASDRSDPFE